MGCSCRVIGAGRTDAGVHAYGQVAHLDIETKIPADRFSYILNQKLPDDIRIVQSWQAAENFHARRDAIGKHYRYTIYQAPHASALERNSSVHVPQQLDVKKMQQAAQVLIGAVSYTHLDVYKRQGIDLPREKRIEIGLTYIYGIGLKSSQDILAATGVDPDIRVKDLSEDDATKIREYICLLYTSRCV